MFGSPGHRNKRRLEAGPPSRSRVLAEDDKHTSASSTSITPSSSRVGGFILPWSMRRAEARPIVEIARPAPDVEFTRASDLVYLGSHNQHAPPDDSVSLRSLRSNQNLPHFSRSSKDAAESESQDEEGKRQSGYNRNNGGGSSGVRNKNNSSTFNRNTSSGKSKYASSDAFEDVESMYANTERDIPFRANAVEIAVQDDKNECTFLIADTVCDFERARSILPMILGQPRPCTSIGFEPIWYNRVPIRPTDRIGGASPNKIYHELERINCFNNNARASLDQVNPGSVLGQFALDHLAKIIRQLLSEINVSADQGWDQVVMKLTLTAIGSVEPNVRAGDSMDLRRFVRIKRIPGGVPQDSQYISGVVFTKNLAHKRMPRTLDSPRIMILAFPLENSGLSKHVAFDEELKAQREFSTKLVKRITAAAPTLVLVERTIPGQILEELMKNKILVAYSVKRTVLRAISRCTGAEIVTSLEKFSDYPRIGTCKSVVVQTYEDPSFPEYRKSFIFMDGCIEKNGCTIVLRGAHFDRLEDIKQVFDLVISLTYSIYLETSLLMNEYSLGIPGKYRSLSSSETAMSAVADTSGSSEETSEKQRLDLITASEALKKYNQVLSSSPCVRIPPPYVLVRMREKEISIKEITERFKKLSSMRRDNPQGNEEATIIGTNSTTGVAFLVSRQQSAMSLNRIWRQYVSEMALHESYIREGEAFLMANPHTVSLWDYQTITVAYMVTCRKHNNMICVGPQHHSIAFYESTDVTLGQYLEEMCFDLNYDCPGRDRRCTHPMYEHRRSYIHNTGKFDVTMDEHPCPIEGLSGVILMWGVCKLCNHTTPPVRMSDSTWRYSFGKYLETTFYNNPLRPRATSLCTHDIHRDYTRFFALRNMAVKFEYTALDLWTIATPTIPLYFDMEVSIRLKEKEAEELHSRLDKYYNSVLSQLEKFPIDLVYEDKVEECLQSVEALKGRATTEKIYFEQTLEQTMRNSHPSDTLVAVVVYETLQSKVIEWNLQFSELAQSFIQVDAYGRTPAIKRIVSNEGLNLANTAATSQNLNPGNRNGHMVDSLEMIDELHPASPERINATKNQNGSGIANACTANDASVPLMPQLGPSPPASIFEVLDNTTSDSDGRRDKLLLSKASRLHRKLSMEMMKKERLRLEKQLEKARRIADTPSMKAKYMRHLQKLEQHYSERLEEIPHPNFMHDYKSQDQQKTNQLQHPASLTESTMNNKHVEPYSTDRDGYNTTRLIGSITTGTDGILRAPPRDTEFPELLIRRTNPHTNPRTDYRDRGRVPAFDLFHDSSMADGEVDTNLDHTSARSRIPGYRPNQQQQQHQQRRGEESASLEKKSLPAADRPLSSFGKPVDTRNSNIPQAPNIRGNSTSPNNPDADDSKISSNVFLRLARRLNSVRGRSDSSSVLGTMPRRMNFLLPAAAQYITTHPDRTPIPQVQVFYTNQHHDSSNRKITRIRRHSDQSTANSQRISYATDDDTYLADSSTYQDVIASASGGGERASSSGAHRLLHVPYSKNSTVHYTPQRNTSLAQKDRARVSGLGNINNDGGSMSFNGRNRSATIARVQSRPSRKSSRSDPKHSHPPPAAHNHLPQTQVNNKNETAKPSTSKAANIIPSITRRLGFGFNFRSGSSSRTSSVSKSSVPNKDFNGNRKDSMSSRRSTGKRNSLRVIIPPKGSKQGKKQRTSGGGMSRPVSQVSNVLYEADYDGIDEVNEDEDEEGYDSSNSELSEEYSTSSSEDSQAISISTDSTTTTESSSSINDSILDIDDGEFTPPTLSAAPTQGPASNIFSLNSDFTLSSPMRAGRRLSSFHQQRGAIHRMSSDKDSGSDGLANLWSSADNHRRNYSHESTITSEDYDEDEDNEIRSNQPNLHFADSDASSDVERFGHISRQSVAKGVSEYLRSAMNEHGEITVADTPAITTTNTTQRPSGAATTSAGSSGAATAVPQESHTTLWKAISGLLLAPGNSQLFQIGLDLKYPLEQTEHVVAGSPIIVRETEPSSIIAFTLMSNEYRMTLQQILESAKDDNNLISSRITDKEGSESVSLGSPNSAGNEKPSPRNEFAQASPSDQEKSLIERAMLRLPAHHLRLEFTADRTRFVCKVFYAAQFDALRKCNGCEDNYVESLSRCVPYLAKGGKSGSAFLKTRDERFIIKQVSKPEMEAFLKFAPYYFEHMHRAYREEILTMLTKLFGFCRISYRNSDTGKSLKMNVMIMENLLYGRKCTRVFDLKGSERNRMVEETNINAVFQDENLIKFIRENPICIRQQTKRHLHDAIWNDTLFLSKLNVMDYSLLVGFDVENKELVVGILDFIRTFTWDKKLESWVKESGILGGGGKGPTIVSPRQYKARFREAMERYFMMVPDKFYDISDEEED